MKVIAVELSNFAGTFNLSLFSDSAGSPGSSLETLATDLTASGTFGIVSASGFTPFSLTSGTQYWLVMTPYGTNTNVGWAADGVPSSTGQFTETADGSGTWGPGSTPFSLQFEIDGTQITTPEPSTFVLLGMALAGLAIFRRRVGTTPVSVVDPTTSVHPTTSPPCCSKFLDFALVNGVGYERVAGSGLGRHDRMRLPLPFFRIHAAVGLRE